MKKIVFFLVFVIQAFSETIGVVGSGYVGLVWSAMLGKWGHKVVCIDNDARKIALLQNGISPIFEPGLQDLLFQNNSITFSRDLYRLENIQILYICLPTPSDAQGNCDCTAIFSVIDQISSLKNGPSIVCIKSTVSPGTLRKIQNSVSPLKAIQWVFAPEFMREGSALEDLETRNPIVLGSDSQETLDRILRLYKPLLDTNPKIEVILSTFETAELIKYAWNGFSALRITFINELSQLCNRFSVDIGTLVKGMSMGEVLYPTKFLKPGCGLGGSCLPKDILGLSRVFEQSGLKGSLIHQTIDSNRKHTETLIGNLMQAVQPGDRVSLLGLSFKANTDDIRHSIALLMITELLKKGCFVSAYDRYAVPSVKLQYPEVAFFDSPYGAVENSDCIVILTDSPEIADMDLKRISALSPKRVIFDYKNIFSPEEAKQQGFHLVNQGRAK